MGFNKKLIAFRRESVALARGEFRVLHSDQDLLIYARVLGDEWVLITANRSEQPHPPMRLELPGLNLTGEREFNALFGAGCVWAGTGWLELPELTRGGEVWQ